MTPIEHIDLFSERLQAARELRKMSQSQLAIAAGLPPSSVSHFEAGARKPSFDNLKRLAVALSVTTDFLLGRSDTPDASGAPGRLHRDQHKLSFEDLNLTEQFVEMLLRRSAEKKKESE